MDKKYDIRNLLIFILCVAVLTFGGYFMYKILDPVDKELDDRGKNFLRLYMEDDGIITDAENEYEVLKLEVAESGAELISYVKDDITDEIKYVVFKTKDLNVYNAKTKKIDPLILEEDYLDGVYYLQLDDKLENILGYYFVSNDGTQEYYQSLNSKKKMYDKYKVEEKTFIDNNYGDYVVISKGIECGKGMYVQSIKEDKEIISGMDISTHIIGNQVFYFVKDECNSTTFSLYNNKLELVRSNLDSLKTSFYREGFYTLDDKTIREYGYSGKEVNSEEYNEVLEVHDGYALLRDSKALYLLNLSTKKKVTVSSLKEDTENVSESAEADFNGKYFRINHHGEVIIKLKIRNVTYSIKKNKMI